MIAQVSIIKIVHCSFIVTSHPINIGINKLAKNEEKKERMKMNESINNK
jgi:hypothetical protein